MFLSAGDSLNGLELWKSDGTANGTVLVKEINNSETGAGSDPSNFINLNGTLFFTADDSTHGRELWKSDGTSTGTVIVKDINPGSASSNTSGFINVNGILYFGANDDSTGDELWKSDGTSNGTTIIKDINIGIDGSRINEMTDYNGVLYFFAYYPSGGSGLWKSDGTYNGTNEVKSQLNNPSNLINGNGKLFFSTRSCVSGGPSGYICTNYIWKSDGTLLGTVNIKQISSGGQDWLYSFTIGNNLLFFSANNGSNGQELWKTDGTDVGTVLVKDIYSGTKSSSPTNLTNVNGTLFFCANDSLQGYEIWKSDGTSNGTVIVKDIYPGGASSGKWGGAPSIGCSINGIVYFGANDGTNGYELWKSDGTTAGTQLVKDINNQIQTEGSNPGGQCSWGGASSSVSINDTFFFSSADGPNGNELWKSDGTESGTKLVKDITPGSGSSGLSKFSNINGLLFFVKQDNNSGSEMWKSDGTEAGTQKFMGIGGTNTSIDELTVAGNSLYYISYNGSNEYLYITDGNSSTLLKSSSWVIQRLTNVNETLFFRYATGYPNNTDELWKTDGTINGTNLVANLDVSQYGDFINFNGTLFFGKTWGSNNGELWKSDGSNWGTQKVKDGFIDAPRNLINNNGTLFFVMRTNYFPPCGPFSLWKSDGTTAGTTIVKTFNLSNGYVSILTATNGFLYLTVSDYDNSNLQLWLSDGTNIHTKKIKDFKAIGTVFGKNGVCYLDGDDGITGAELWISDGTALGTVNKDINPGSNSSNPCNFTEMNGSVYFSADNGIYGSELWALDNIKKMCVNLFYTKTDASCDTCKDGKILIDVVGGQVPYQYTWSNGSSQKDLSNVTVGSYTITITDASGCSITEKITIENKNTIGFDELWQQKSNEITIVPNPAKGSVKISFATINNKNINITLYDIMGKVKYQTEEKVNSEFYSKEIDFSTFIQGIYFLKVRNGEMESVKKIVITK